MDDVRELLAGLADRAVDDAPAVDPDADVARGRRALRRIRTRRLVAGLLTAAAVTAAVVVMDLRSRPPGGEPAEVPSAADTGIASGPAVVLAANRTAWGDISCGLLPAGWRPQQIRPGQVELAPPGATGTAGREPAGRLVLRTAAEAERISQVQAERRPGRIVHLGRAAGGERVGQVKLGELWLVVRVPPDAAAGQGWVDATLLRLIDSCTVRAGATPAG